VYFQDRLALPPSVQEKFMFEVSHATPQEKLRDFLAFSFDVLEEVIVMLVAAGTKDLCRDLLLFFVGMVIQSAPTLSSITLSYLWTESARNLAQVTCVDKHIPRRACLCPQMDSSFPDSHSERVYADFMVCPQQQHHCRTAIHQRLVPAGNVGGWMHAFVCVLRHLHW
jgi:hypothetical protein